jgi:hypothetical protein
MTEPCDEKRPDPLSRHLLVGEAEVNNGAVDDHDDRSNQAFDPLVEQLPSSEAGE